MGAGTSPLFVYIPLIIGFLSLRSVKPVSCRGISNIILIIILQNYIDKLSLLRVDYVMW